MSQHPALVFLDRTAVLFCGVAAGIAIGLAFAPQINGQLGGLLGDAQGQLQSDGPDELPAGPAPGTVPGGPALPAGVANAGRVPDGLARAVAAGRPFRIGVFGDSFGDGLWAALYNQLPRREAFQVLRFSQQATGFTRYRQTNLQDQLAGQLAQGPVDVAVISFGANDVQGLFVDGRVAPLLSPRWQAEVTARITRYVETLRAQGAAVVWVGLPVMRDAQFDGQIQGLNRFHARVMAQLGVPFIDTRGAAVGADGGYASHLPDPRTGAPWLVRAGDGIHMSMKGYRLLTDTLAARLRAWGQAARGGSAVLPDQVPPPAALTPLAPPAAAAAPAPVEAPAVPMDVPADTEATASAPPTNLLPDVQSPEPAAADEATKANPPPAEPIPPQP